MTFATSSLGILYAEAQARDLEAALAEELARIGEYVQSIPPPPSSSRPQAVSSTGSVGSAGGGGRSNLGPHSDAWWMGVSRCEQGGNNNPFYGFFSIMDGSAGGLPWDVQVGMANGIIARYGDGAWAAACVAAGYAASPGG